MGFKKPSLNVASFVDKPGWYHVIVTSAKDGVQNQGSAFTNLQVQTTVLATNAGEDQIKRHLKLELMNPDAGMKDGGEFSFQTQCRLAVATDCFAVVTNEAGELQYANVADVPEGQEIERLEFFGPEHEADPENVNPNIVSKQLIVKVKERKWTSKDGSKSGVSYELDGAHIYHVEDPEVAAYPKDGKAIAQGGYKLVQAPASGNGAVAGNGAANGTAKPAANKPAAAAGSQQPGTSAKVNGVVKLAVVGGGAKPGPAAGKPAAAASNFDGL